MSTALPRCWTLYILESDEAVRESICALAASNGWHYRAYGRLEDFTAAGAGSAPACLLVDWDLSHVQMRSFLDTLHERHPHLPVVIMTARDDEPTLARIRLAQPSAVLPRPFSFAELSDAVDEAFTAKTA